MRQNTRMQYLSHFLSRADRQTSDNRQIVLDISDCPDFDGSIFSSADNYFLILAFASPANMVNL